MNEGTLRFAQLYFRAVFSYTGYLQCQFSVFKKTKENKREKKGHNQSANKRHISAQYIVERECFVMTCDIMSNATF